MAEYHIPVMPRETIDALDVREGGIYIDATAGGGGHSALILERLGRGRLICIDRDPDAVKELNARFSADSRVSVVNSNFSCVKEVMADRGLAGADGILVDLGLSSHQIDTDRGFSYSRDEKLDMRMSQSGVSAADIVNGSSVEELTRILRDYGEEKFAFRIARSIADERAKAPIETTGQLAQIVKDSIPAPARRTGGNPCKRSFQAIRIAVNDELDSLPASFDSMFSSLNKDGRLAVITFHSLEDRIVKTFINQLRQGCTCPPDFPVCVCGKKPRGSVPFSSVTPSSAELETNPRSASARLRCVIKL